MDRIFARSYALFFIILMICTAGLLNILASGEREIAKTDAQVAHTYNLITVAEELSALVEGMLAAQRGYIITADPKFKEKYTVQRNKINKLIETLDELTSDNQSQSKRVDEIQKHFTEFSIKLEERAQKYTSSSAAARRVLENVEEFEEIKDSIIHTNNAVLQEEYGLLEERINILESSRSLYFTTVSAGVSMAVILLMLFNGISLHFSRKRRMAAALTQDSEERLALAVEGAQDGIFDWNLQSGDVFYSRQFFSMLGYDRDSFIGTTEEFKELLSPEDSENFWAYAQNYFEGLHTEYRQEFRMRAKDGRWRWIQSNAKAVFDDDGTPLRLVGTHADITALKEHQARLEADKKAAEAANRAKSDFLAHMSHEIRTPLTAISGIAEIFEKNMDSLNDKQKKLMKTLHSSAFVLKDLINDILDFSKIESGELDLDEEVFDVSVIFEEIIAMMSLRAQQKKIGFVFDYTDVKNMAFRGDKVRLRQIIVNLVGNAVKFTEDGGIMVRAYKEDRAGKNILRIDVTDTGIGISPENFDTIFQRFKQADASVSRRYGGTGLGLSISRNLARLMGGDIVLSSAVGEGSTFSVLLPIKVGGKKEDKISAPEETHKIDKEKLLVSGTDKRILMVEDYEGNIVVLGHILDEMGCPYDIARTGLEALELWSKGSYDLILMDIQMPLMDGLAATASIRKFEKEKGLKPIPIIGMTAHALIGDKDKCITAGMDSYLPKPIVEENLRTQILKYLNRNQKAA